MNKAVSGATRRVVRQAIGLLFVGALIPYGFVRLDAAYVYPTILKKNVSVFGVQTSVSESHRRVRFGVAALSDETQTVKVTAIWRDEAENEVGRSEQEIAVTPNDTVFVSLMTRNSQTISKVMCSIVYEVIPPERR
ncbi:MAG: hypothetical protein FJY97_13950 [candidate division Zixibacteria bacterium]|nr:hypothetical protein [candidate division Zixibacteria bacterium]